MKIKNKMFIAGMSLMMALGTFSTVAAANVVSGTKYQRVTHVDIPGNGGIKYNMNYGSQKATTGKYATFKKIKADALLGNYVILVNSSKSVYSVEVGLSTSGRLAGELGATKGNTYYAAVSSSSLEPSNTCDTTIDFSADALISG